MDSTLHWAAGRDAQRDVVCGALPHVGAFKFYLTTAVASAQASTSSVPVLYNPAVSTCVDHVWIPLVVLRVMAVRIGVVSGTVVPGSILYGLASDITFSSTAETGAASFNTFVGRGAATPAKFYTTATASAAPSILFPAGFNAGGNLAAGPLFTLRDDVNGSIVLPPGGSFWPFIANGAAAPAVTALVTVDVVQTLMIDRY